MDLDLHMAPDLTAPAQARKAITGLRGHVDGDVLSDTVLLVSELVSNSVRHAGLSSADSITLEVWVEDGLVRGDRSCSAP